MVTGLNEIRILLSGDGEGTPLVSSDSYFPEREQTFPQFVKIVTKNAPLKDCGLKLVVLMKFNDKLLRYHQQRGYE